MSWRYFVFIYIVIPLALSLLTYAVLRDLVGILLSIVAGVCIGTLFMLAYLNMLGRSIRWK